MKLADLLSEQVIKIPLEATRKEEVIEELIDLLVRAGKVEDKEKILAAVLERERLMSTAVGDGVAIPHGKAEGVRELAACFGKTKEAIDFQSLDDQPVRLVFMLVGPPEITGPHLKALSRISRLLHKKDFREKLLAARTPREVLNTIANEEARLFEL
ncbi:MAG: PTS sugar transporter subunit IIA [candidate division KSB1 bacterium]|nr:PTS sugar transporter subunit IIA [candidate division KSB1 bacterium]